MHILMIIFIIFEIVIGVASTLYIVASLFWVLGQKIYRKCRYHASLYD